MGNCLACREAGRRTPATYVVTVYVTGEAQLPKLSCDAHAMVDAVTAIAGGHSVAAMTASGRREPEGVGEDPGPEAGSTPAAGQTAGRSGWLAGVGRAVRRLFA